MIEELIYEFECLRTLYSLAPISQRSAGIFIYQHESFLSHKIEKLKYSRIPFKNIAKQQIKKEKSWREIVEKGRESKCYCWKMLSVSSYCIYSSPTFNGRNTVSYP